MQPLAAAPAPTSQRVLMSRSLVLTDYDAAWPMRFAAEVERIGCVLPAPVIAIEHVGSTAVPGLPGKPVLDIAIAVVDDAAADACIPALVSLGFRYRGTNGDDPRRRYYSRDDAGVRAVQIHLYILPALAFDEQLAFRDALRADPLLAAAYAAEKRRVATAVAWDTTAYSIAKGPFVQAVLAGLRDAR
jgi:GrpB-like predicted nucleotidyltransferase (UPF0157 family)